MKSRKIVVLVLLSLVLTGCSSSPPPSKVTWMAQPEFAEANNRSFRIKIEPQKGEYPYYAHFSLTIKNTGDSALSIDWNQSRYLFNGKPQGMFVFEGINPEAVKSATIPLETISSGSAYSRQIMPLRLVAWRPIKEKTMENRSILPGMFPEGENGIRLVMRYGEKQVDIHLSVRVFKESHR